MKLNNKNIISGLVTSLLLTVCTEGKTNTLVHEIIDSGLSLCTEKTQLYYPKGYPHLSKLREFKTCVSPLTITVLNTGELEVSDGLSTWKGTLKPTGDAIQPK